MSPPGLSESHPASASAENRRTSSPKNLSRAMAGQSIAFLRFSKLLLIIWCLATAIWAESEICSTKTNTPVDTFTDTLTLRSQNRTYTTTTITTAGSAATTETFFPTSSYASTVTVAKIEPSPSCNAPGISYSVFQNPYSGTSLETYNTPNSSVFDTAYFADGVFEFYSLVDRGNTTNPNKVATPAGKVTVFYGYFVVPETGPYNFFFRKSSKVRGVYGWFGDRACSGSWNNNNIEIPKGPGGGIEFGFSNDYEVNTYIPLVILQSATSGSSAQSPQLRVQGPNGSVFTHLEPFFQQASCNSTCSSFFSREPAGTCGSGNWQVGFTNVSEIRTNDDTFSWSSIHNASYQYIGTTPFIGFPSSGNADYSEAEIYGHETYLNGLAINHQAFYTAPYSGVYRLYLQNRSSQAGIWLGPYAYTDWSDSNGQTSISVTLARGQCIPVRVAWVEKSLPAGFLLDGFGPLNEVITVYSDACCSDQLLPPFPPWRG